MAYTESRFRPALAGLIAFLVGCAVFVYDSLAAAVAYVGHSLFSRDLILDHRTRLHVDSMEREMRASTIELTPLGARFKAFIQRRREHAFASDGGYLPEMAHPAV